MDIKNEIAQLLPRLGSDYHCGWFFTHHLTEVLFEDCKNFLLSASNIVQLASSFKLPANTRTKITTQGLTCEWYWNHIGGKKLPYGAKIFKAEDTHSQSLPSLPATLQYIHIDHARGIANLPALPRGLQILQMRGMAVRSLGLQQACNLKIAKISGCENLQAISGLPDGLQILRVSSCYQLAYIGTLPATLQVLAVSSSRFPLPALPEGLLVLSLNDCQFGFWDLPQQFPSSLMLLNLNSIGIKWTDEQIHNIKKRLPKGCKLLANDALRAI